MHLLKRIKNLWYLSGLTYEGNFAKKDRTFKEYIGLTKPQAQIIHRKDPADDIT